MSTQVPKYRFLKSKIKDWAFSGEIRPGEQVPTEFQLAEKFQMSRQTVRMAINELVHEGVLFRIQGKGTFLSENFLQQKESSVSHNIVAVITTYISDYIFPEIIRGIESRLSQEDYSMLLLSTNNNLEKEAQALDSVLQRPVDGVILEPTKSSYSNPNTRRFLSIMAKQVPIVTLHGSYVELGSPCVRMDDEQAGLMAAQHLADFGHLRLGMISKTDDIQGKLRLRGFIKAHRRNSIALNPEWMRFYITEEEDAAVSHYAQSLAAAAPSDRPTGVVCYNDAVAVKLIHGLGEYGIHVPNDISVVSFDDSNLAEANQLTTVQHPKYEMGIKVAEYILTSIRNGQHNSEEDLDDYVYNPQLTIRMSTRDIRD